MGDQAVVLWPAVLREIEDRLLVEGAVVDVHQALVETGQVLLIARQPVKRLGDDQVQAVVAVHMNGHACDLEALAEIAAKHGISMIEDACHALGTSYETRSGETFRVGGSHHSAMSCFSFHPVKTIAMGEGGAVTTNDPDLYDQLKRLRNYGRIGNSACFSQPALAFGPDGEPNPWYYEMAVPGFNYRVSDIHCALGLSQLRKLDRFIARRQSLGAAYDARFAAFPETVRPIPRAPRCDPVCHLYVLGIDFDQFPGRARGQVMRALADRGIGTQVHFLPVHHQPYYVNLYGPQDLPGADAYYAKALSIPLFPAMTDADVDRVVTALADVFDLRIPG